jgi:hypothetical protein
MIDLFTLALTHVLMAYAAISMIARDDLDADGEAKPAKRWQRKSADNPGPKDS